MGAYLVSEPCKPVLGQLLDDAPQAVGPLPGPPFGLVCDVDLVVLLPYGDIFKSRSGQQLPEEPGGVERLLDSAPSNVDVGEDIVLPCPARILLTPCRHPYDASRQQDTAKLSDGSCGIRKEEDAERAKDDSERRS